MVMTVGNQNKHGWTEVIQRHANLSEHARDTLMKVKRYVDIT